MENDIKITKKKVTPIELNNKGPKRVVIYTRVSTSKRPQLLSLSNQLSALTQLIAKEDNWKLVDIYMDVASSTPGSERRQFARLFQDAQSNKFDIVYIKSVSRLGRDTVETLQILRALMELNIEVKFDSELISTSDPSSVMIIPMLETIAQEDNKVRSENIKWGMNRSLENSNSKMYNRKCFGYTNDENGNLIIETYEAEIVKLIFQLYLDGYSVVGICKELNNRNILSPTGNPNWAKRTIEKILNNEKYTGDVLNFKTYTHNYTSVVNIGQHDQMICEKHHEPIISHEIFKQVKIEKQRRSNINVTGHGVVRSSTKYSSKNQEGN